MQEAKLQETMKELDK